MPKRVDQNHAEIVRALRQVPGVTVHSLHEMGNGCPDLLVGYRSITTMIEVKTAKGKLNALQQDWHDRWTGSPVVVIRSVNDVDGRHHPQRAGHRDTHHHPERDRSGVGTGQRNNAGGP